MASRPQRLALALSAAALLSAPAAAQLAGSSASAVSRIDGNVSVTGTTINDNTLAGPAAGATPEAVGDQQLLSELVTALATDARMTGARINVEVNDGRVTLGGVARDTVQSQQAREIADGVAGSANVTNRLTTGG
jgi:osmotically-inducible protein OsmY